MRQQADYEDFISLQDVDILPLIPKTKDLIQEIERIILSE